MFLLHVDISENGFYTTVSKFNSGVTKLENADEIRSLDRFGSGRIWIRNTAGGQFCWNMVIGNHSDFIIIFKF